MGDWQQVLGFGGAGTIVAIAVRFLWYVETKIQRDSAKRIVELDALIREREAERDKWREAYYDLREKISTNPFSAMVRNHLSPDEKGE